MVGPNITPFLSAFFSISKASVAREREKEGKEKMSERLDRLKKSRI